VEDDDALIRKSHAHDDSHATARLFGLRGRIHAGIRRQSRMSTGIAESAASEANAHGVLMQPGRQYAMQLGDV
jgi:hypothetical protein